MTQSPIHSNFSVKAATAKISMLALAVLVLASCGTKEESSSSWDPLTAEIGGERDLVLTQAPEVPAPSESGRHALKLKVEVEVLEQVGRLADGVEYDFWTFGGKVPGQFIRVREGDIVEFTLKNHPNNKFAHNIDLHAVTGPGGGATSSFTAPGHETVFSFRAINPGTYVYHCATAPVGMHIANGMYGLIQVDPKEGLPKVDREYYVMQGDFYTRGKYGESGVQAFDMDKALREEADYVVFNGEVGSLTGDNSLKAEVGETVRLFVGNGGPNLLSSFHVIGEIFDNVQVEGGSLINKNVQTTLIPAGGAAVVDFKVDVPGTFILVDHSIFRAFNKGALGQLVVTGPENKDIYTGQQDERIYQDEGGAVQQLPVESKKAALAQGVEQRVKAGGIVYNNMCKACHQGDGMGFPGVYPPLAASDYFKGNPGKAIEAIVNGLDGPITVNGKSFNSTMPGQNLTDEEVANVVTYILNAFKNDGGEVTPAMVAAKRK